MVFMAKQKIKSSQIKGAKYLKEIISQLKPLHDIEVDPLRPNKRQLHMDEYVAMFLMYIAIIACLLIMLWTGKKPSKATFEMLYYFMIGLADEEDLQEHLARLKKQA